MVDDHRLSGVPGFAGNWVEAGCSCLFFTREADHQVRSLCRAEPDLEIVAQHLLSYGRWQSLGTDMLLLDSLAVVSPWSMATPPKGIPTIIVHPGLVFGSGTHSTTVDCLRAIQRVCREQQVRTMVDLGTGTGILALAAAKLGCPRVVAVDQVMLSARTARLNVERNRLAERVLVVNGRAEEGVVSGCDLLAANLGGGSVTGLLRNGFKKPPRYLVLSGFLQSQAKPVEALLAAPGYRTLEVYLAPDGWQTMLVAASSGHGCSGPGGGRSGSRDHCWSDLPDWLPGHGRGRTVA